MGRMEDRREEEVARKTIEYIQQIENAAGLPHFNLNTAEDYEVQILADKLVSIGKFRADKTIPHIYFAHPDTIRAMKKNIFATGNDLEEMAQAYTCPSCSAQMDKQFWHFCPFCGTGFADNES